MKNKNMPGIIYGTAWKGDDTETLVNTAVKNGFTGIDTANQRRHYNEQAVGNALSRLFDEGINRENLFIQTKYTYPNGQDHRIPYDINADYDKQVRQSFQSSLEHLKINKIDSYILHGPYANYGFGKEDWTVWKEMEIIYNEGLILNLGVSNVSVEQLKTLYDSAKVKPTFVQNRCFAQQGWDKDVREFCKENNMTYQGFSLLTANPFVLPLVKDISNKLKKTPAQIVLRFAMQIGILPLTGTTNDTHMKEDLELNFTIDDKDIDFIKNIAT